MKNNIIDLTKYKELLNTWWWDCPCGKTHKEEVLICDWGINCNTYPLYKKVPKEIINLIEGKMT